MTLITAPRVLGTVPVAPGREFGFAEFGVPDGATLIWLHGTPGGRRQVPEGARAYAAENGVRIIGLDRPGIGASTAHLYDAIVDFAADLEVAVDALGVDDFAIVGLSGGGPYALAAGRGLGDRVRAVGSLGGVAPSVGPDAIDGGAVEFAFAIKPLLDHGRVPLAKALTGLLRLAAPFGSPALNLYAKFSRDGDRRFLRQPESKQMFLDDLIQASRTQFSAPICDGILFTRDWGFRLAGVDVPVHWWHGDDDPIIPFAHGEHCARLLPQATFHTMVGESHLGGMTLGREVIETLLVGDRR